MSPLVRIPRRRMGRMGRGPMMMGARPRRGLAVRGLFALLLVGAMAFLIWKLFT